VIDLAFRQRLLIRTATGNGALGAGIQWIVKDGTLGVSVGLAAAESRQENRANSLAGMDDRSGSAFGTTSLFLRVGRRSRCPRP